jgi:hypothetical protein
MIHALRNRHSTADERRLGHGLMKARTITYRIEKSDLLARLREAQQADPTEEGYTKVKSEDIACAEAGRPVPERLLKSLYGDLERYFVAAEPDAVADAEDLWKSPVEGERAFEPLTLIQEEIVAADNRMPGTSPLVKSAVQVFIPVGEKAELRDRLFKAIASGDPRVHETDIAAYDAGRLSERAFRAVYQDAEIVELAEGQDFADAAWGRQTSGSLRRAAAELDDLVKSLEGRRR